MGVKEMIEKGAEAEHEQWAHWTKYMLDNLTPKNIERWKRQIETPYHALTEKEKEADRVWAIKALLALNLIKKCPECGGTGIYRNTGHNAADREGVPCPNPTCHQGYIAVKDTCDYSACAYVLEGQESSDMIDALKAENDKLEEIEGIARAVVGHLIGNGENVNVTTDLIRDMNELKQALAEHEKESE